jgi:Glycosyl hydrolases family 28
VNPPPPRGRALTRRDFVRVGANLAAAAALVRPLRAAPAPRDFDVADFGAAGDGRTPDTAAIQRAIDRAAAAGRSRVLLRGGRKYLIGTLVLKGGVDFHLADDAELVVSARPADYTGGAALTAQGAEGLRISGTGSIDGRSPEFMLRYDAANQWWIPRPFRPRLAVLAGCRDLEVSGVTFRRAPFWTLHLLGCRGALVDGIKVRNELDVPNCDGIDPDHCRDLEIRGCDLRCGDDCIVIKTTRAGAAYGSSENIRVHDCVLETQDAGLKIGTETTQDLRGLRFERCRIKSSGRGLCIQLRDEGDIEDVLFRDIDFTARYFSAPWWGRGEAISLTAIPRAPGGRIGVLRRVRIERVTGRAENSVRLCGSPESRLREIRLDRVAVTLDRWTPFPGGVWDNRPTTAEPALEPHDSPVYGIVHADRVTLADCRAAWGANRPEYFTSALEATDVTGLACPGFQGRAAHPGRDPAIRVNGSPSAVLPIRAT